MSNYLAMWRHFPAWRKYVLRPEGGPISDAIPWISYPAIRRLQQILTENDRVFEWGGGGSSLFFVDRVQELITVEHDTEWYHSLLQEKKEKGVQNWRIVSAPPVHGKDEHSSSSDRYRGMSFRAYCRSITQFDGEFDIIVIDGRAREKCLDYAHEKIAPAGVIVFDNTERKKYRDAISQYEKDYSVENVFGPAPYAQIFTMTTFMRRLS
ncbi:class I SAM-dependent methyltransferase [bacterium]|nr:class I SAM-dependent methyltransferase [bacterium]